MDNARVQTEKELFDKRNDAVRDKKERKAPEPLVIADADSVREVAIKLISKFHHELASANFIFLFRSKSLKSGGKPVPGVVKKASPVDAHISRNYFQGFGKDSGGPDDTPPEADFIMTMAADVWNTLQPNQRVAVVDHLLTRCVAAEDEKSGEMRYSIRPPQVQEFPSVAERNGQYNDDLAEFANCLHR